MNNYLNSIDVNQSLTQDRRSPFRRSNMQKNHPGTLKQHEKKQISQGASNDYVQQLTSQSRSKVPQEYLRFLQYSSMRDSVDSTANATGPTGSIDHNGSLKVS